MDYDVGAWAEFAAAEVLTSLGCHVFFPRAGQPPTDFVFMQDGKAYSCQVKMSNSDTFDLRHNAHSKTYDVGTFDFFVMVRRHHDGKYTVYMLPHTKRRTSWRLGKNRYRDNLIAFQLEALREACQPEA